MKNKSKIFFFLFFFLSKILAFSQMPTDGDFSNWNWENQNQDNWKTKYGSTWTNINPPFSTTTARVGDIADVYTTMDYQQNDGWELVWAKFDGANPYFVLYNKYRGLVRTFIYNDGNSINYLLTTLSFDGVDNPGILSFLNTSSNATDKYLNGTASNDDDMISVIVPALGASNWCSVDFPIFLDNNILNSKYSLKEWKFNFYNCSNYNIKIKGTNILASSSQQTIVGKKSDVLVDEFLSTNAKLYKGFESNNDFLQNLQNSVSSVDSNDYAYLKEYAKKVNAITDITSVFSENEELSSESEIVLGFLKSLSGTFDNQNSSKPNAVVNYVSLEGSMDINSILGSSILKISGVNGTPDATWAYNCPLGYFNMKTTPTIKKTYGYWKYGCRDAVASFGLNFLIENNGISYLSTPLELIPNYQTLPDLPHHQYSNDSRYKDRIVKFKFDDNISLVYNDLDGLDIIDINFAIVASPQYDLTNNRPYYEIDEKILGQHIFYTTSLPRQSYDVDLENPVYSGLQEGRYVIHKFDKENNDVVFGTPYLPMNDLKGIVLEVPEKTDIKLSVIARFSSTDYDKPIIFKADYNLNIAEEPYGGAEFNIYFNSEQYSFPYSDYYTTNQFYTEIDYQTSDEFVAGKIVMLPGFIGNTGFKATSTDIYPSNVGNTVIEAIDFDCETSQRSASKSHFENESSNNIDENNEKQKTFESEIYPNPTNGIIYLTSNNVSSIKTYNINGSLIQEIKASSIDLSSYPNGIYLLEVNGKMHKVVKE